MRYRFGDHKLDLHAGTLMGPQGEVHLRLKTFELLRELVQRAGQVVPRLELLRAVWGEVCLGDDALAQAVSELRRALGDDSRTPRYIETLHRRGYRFVGPVVVETDGPSTDPMIAAAVPVAVRPRPRRARWAWALAAPSFVGCAALLVSRHQPAPRAHQGLRVAVLDLQPEGAGPDWLCEALPELVAEELERYRGIAIYSRERLARAGADVGLGGPLSPVQALALGQYLDADFVAGGTCRREGDGVEVVLSLYDGRGERALLSVSQNFPDADIGWQAEHWSREIGNILLPGQEPPPSAMVRRNVPPSALEAYTKGRRLVPEDPKAALALLDQAAKSRPKAWRFQRQRARALMSLGEHEKAEVAARLARNNRQRKGRGAEAEYLRTLGKAEQSLALLAEIAPGREPEEWLDTLEVLQSSGRSEAVLAAVDSFEGAFDKCWLAPEFALIEARAAQQMGNSVRQVEAARRAARLAWSRGHRSTAERAQAIVAELREDTRSLNASLAGS
jgi:DNA-binding winged helix-turn-helix (wHTH) protein